MIAGEDLLPEEHDDLSQFVELKKFLGAINGKETAHDIFTKVAFDLKLQGAFALNVIYSKDRSKIAEVHHIPVEQLRVGTPDENGIVRDYYISADWAQYRKKEYMPRRVAAFNANDRREGSQILYTGLYSPAMELYHTPDYVAATNWVQVDNLTSDFHLNNIANGFSGSYFINFSNGIPTQEERQQIERQITQKFMLLGVKTEGQLGGRNELTQAYELYMNTVVKPYQNTILRTFKRLLAVNGVVVPFGVKDTQPLNSLFGADILKDVLTQDEIREEAGYAPLETGEQSVTEEVNMSSDNILDDLIDLYGEDENLEEWELIDEEDATDEHEDFDFQYNIEKLELASTGRAIPNAKSEQDGVSTQTHKTKYRVRYVYTTEKTFNNVNKGLPSREFCDKMVKANKIYRKEDIIRMGSQAVNKGWGLRGADTYSIWKFKGGGDCRHKWFRRIYIQAGDKATRDDRVITTTKARSRGFKPQVNEQEVSVAPKNMDNRGFVTKQMN